MTVKYYPWMLACVAWLSGCESSGVTAPTEPVNPANETMSSVGPSVPRASPAANGGISAAAVPSVPVAGNMAAANAMVASTAGSPETPPPSVEQEDAGVEQKDAGTSDAGSMPTTPADLRCHADAQAPKRTDYGKDGPFRVGTLEVTFKDQSRPIPKTDKHAAEPARTLVTTIYYPSAGTAPLGGSAPLAKGGPFPLLVHSHGYSSSREEAAPAAKRAASHGYVVFAADFPLTNLSAPGGPDTADVVNQPGDVSYLIDQALSFSKDSKHVLANAIDDTRIGAMGVSLGGLTTLLVTFHPKWHDERIKAALPIAALSSFFAEGFYHTRELPTLFVHGDNDAFVDYEQNGRRAYMRALPSSRLMTVAKGSHTAFGVALDKDSVQALNGLLGAPGADPSNPDGFGCGAVGDDLNKSNMSAPTTFVDALGGAENFIEATPPPVPCRGDEYKKPALDPQAQQEIAVRSTVAFFEAYLGKTPEIRKDGCRYLLHEVTKDPAVELD